MRIIGTGSFLPNTIVSNKEITDTPEWVEYKLGIKERRMTNNLSSDIGAIAAERAIKSAGLEPLDIDMIIVATSTPDKMSPSTAAIIQDKIGAYSSVCFDINAVCTGFIYALLLADKLSQDYRNILVIGVDTFTHITDWKNRDCVFFGDGSGAVVINKGYYRGCAGLRTDGRGRHGFYCDHGDTFNMDGHAVYIAGTTLLPSLINKVLQSEGLTIGEIDYMLPHQASIGMLKKLADIIGIDWSKVLTNMDKYGNTAAASIPILLDENEFKLGDRLLLAAIGSGWTYGAIILEWS